MNILVFHFKESFHIELLNRIIVDRPDDTFFVYWEMPGLVDRPNVIDKSTDFLTLLTGRELSFKYHELLPLDNDTLVRMSRYEYMSKRILQRYASFGHTNKFFRRRRRGVFSLLDSILTAIGDNSSSFVLSFDELHSHYLNFLRYWSHFYRRNKIDYIIADQIPHNGLDYISYVVSQQHNVRCIFGHFIPIWGNQVFYDGLNVERRFIERLETNRKSYALESVALNENFQCEVDELRSEVDDDKVHWAGDFQLHSRLWTELSTWKARIADIHLRKIGKDDRSSSLLVRVLRSLLLKGINLLAPAKTYEGSLKRLISSLMVVPDLSKRYIYFPLHYQPEASSQPLGDYNERLILVLEQLSHCCKDCVVYVKEHHKISAIPNRSLDFYQRIGSLPCVYLIDSTFSSRKLIRNSFAVATISGTAGWEAFIMGIPVLLFGFNLLHAADKGVYKINSYQDLIFALNEIIDYDPDYKFVDIFLKTIEECYPKAAMERYVFMRSGMPFDEWCSILKNEFLRRLSVKVQEV